jgi:hypothetical protein
MSIRIYTELPARYTRPFPDFLMADRAMSYALRLRRHRAKACQRRPGALDHLGRDFVGRRSRSGSSSELFTALVMQ